MEESGWDQDPASEAHGRELSRPNTLVSTGAADAEHVCGFGDTESQPAAGRGGCDLIWLCFWAFYGLIGWQRPVLLVSEVEVRGLDWHRVDVTLGDAFVNASLIWTDFVPSDPRGTNSRS